ncbi:MAG: 6-phosphofructokinase [Chloroflexi bacterium]|nr:6-phosphofructokinase [Chloroflexota bacterium]
MSRKKKTIAILTGGGDVPGLNPCMKQLVYRGIDAGYRVLGFRRGWSGPLFYNLEDDSPQEKQVIELDKAKVRTIDRTGGTFLHTSRTNPSNVSRAGIPEFLRPQLEPLAEGQERFDLTPHVLRVLEHLGIDILIPIGGDDTLSYAARMHQEGIPVLAIPKTMDNDVFGTDYCIGFSTAVTRSVSFIHALRTSAGSHERIAVIELFGRHSGETSLVSAYLAGVERAIISEVPFDPQKLARLLLKDKRENPSNYVMVTISEGATMIGGDVVEAGKPDAYGHKKLGGIGEMTSELLRELTGENTLYQRLSYLMRAGEPDSLDLMVAINYANMAMDLIERGATGRMVALQSGVYTHVPIGRKTEGTKQVDVGELYDVEEYRPKILHTLGKPMFLY